MIGSYESEGMLTVETNGNTNDVQVLAKAVPYMSFSQNSRSFAIMMRNAHVGNGINNSTITDRGDNPSNHNPGDYSCGEHQFVIDTRGTDAWGLLDFLCDGDRCGLLRKHAVAVRLQRIHDDPSVEGRAQAVRELRKLNNSSNRAHEVHDHGAALPDDYPPDTPFNSLPWPFDQWSPLVSDMAFRASVAARMDCDGSCGVTKASCKTHQEQEGCHCWRFEAKISITKAQCVAEWIKRRLGLGSAARGVFRVSSEADLHTFYQTVVEPFCVRKGQRFAFMWLVCMQQKSYRHQMPFAPPAMKKNPGTGRSEWMDAAIGCGIPVWDCSA